MAPSQATLDQGKVQEFFGKVVQDVAATLHAGLVLIGDKLGLYRAMAGAGPLTPADLAKRTGTRERYVREWLSAQAAGGYVTYDPATGSFTLPPGVDFRVLPGNVQVQVNLKSRGPSAKLHAWTICSSLAMSRAAAVWPLPLFASMKSAV